MKMKYLIFYQTLVLFVILSAASCSKAVTLPKELKEKGFIGNLYDDGENRKHKTIILLGGSNGGLAWNSESGKKKITYLVNEGYAVLSVAYFKYDGLPNSLEDIPLEYFEKIFLWLSHQPNIVPNNYAIIGASKGAELALLLGSRYSEVRIEIGISPLSAVFQGIPSGFRRPSGSWSYNGQTLPYVKIGISFTFIKALFTKEWHDVYKKALENHDEQLNQAYIQAENINGPILLLSGVYDKVGPCTEMSKQIVERLKANEFKYEYKHVVYKQGHVLDEYGFTDICKFLFKYFPRTVKDVAL
jgi:hypothetical protein